MPLPTFQLGMSEVLCDDYQVPNRGVKPSSPSAEGGAVCVVVGREQVARRSHCTAL